MHNELNLGNFRTDDRHNIVRNRHLLQQRLGLSRPVIFPAQAHTANIKQVKKDTDAQELHDTDALITNEPDVMIGVLVADCVPVLLMDKKQSVIGIAHSGWRGTVKQIVPRTIQKMAEAFGADPVYMMAGIGPSIGPEVYEVGWDVAEQFGQFFGYEEPILRPGKKDKAFLNLPLAIYEQLCACGLKPQNIEQSNICTYTNYDCFFSARRNDFGRFAAGLMLSGK